jgi:hypothetical protein
MPEQAGMNFSTKPANTRADCFCRFVVAASRRILMHLYNRAIQHVSFVIAIFFNAANIVVI